MNLITGRVSMAVGAVIWGTLASWTDTRTALGASAGSFVLLLAMNRRVRVAMGEEAHVTPGVQMPDLAIDVEPKPDDGPVLIQLEYRIDQHATNSAVIRTPSDAAPKRGDRLASSAISRRRGSLRRTGFVIRSWGEYVRLAPGRRWRTALVQSHAEDLQRPDVPIRVSRLIGVDLMEAAT
jgi:hypothetical protein